MKERGYVVWLTGLSGSGKTTIGRSLEIKLKELGFRVELLDGDEVRKQLSPDLGFTKNDRETHARRVVYLSRLLAKNGIITLVSLIAPYRSFREYARKEISDYVEVYVKTPLETCIKRDPKGLYKKALKGEITDMTGIQDPYETPVNPELVIETEHLTVDQSAELIMARLKVLGYVPEVSMNGVPVQAD
jgi:adenylylsulfate kinase